MKYKSTIWNKNGVSFEVTSLDDYEVTNDDILSFTEVVQDEKVRKYITDEAMTKYGFSSFGSYAKEMLEDSPKKWLKREELRFIIRDKSRKIVGMIGVDLRANGRNELWYFKVATSPSFMFEALQKVLSFLKEEGIKAILATFKPDNLRTQDILKNSGFVKTTNENEMILNL